MVDLQGLEPDTRYGYVLYARDRERVMLGHNRLRRFRTPPPESERRAFQFALFSCNMPYSMHGLFAKRTEASNLDMWTSSAPPCSVTRTKWTSSSPGATSATATA